MLFSQSRRRKTLITNLFDSLKIWPCVTPFQCRRVGCIYIYIYIFTNLLSTSIHGYKKKKRKKKLSGTRDKNISNHCPGEKRKNVIGQKERKGQPRHTSRKKSRDVQSVGEKKTKTCRKRCNVTITRVLNTSGANYKINLNRESEFSY